MSTEGPTEAGGVLNGEAEAAWRIEIRRDYDLHLDHERASHPLTCNLTDFLAGADAGWAAREVQVEALEAQ